ncbi:hypothetical protein B0H19DRAFT_1375131 [Mycena capillaripes]|nr:hypothetical protein B0H19DRAFT_1375131 [Mycena capillaripes]
MDYQYSFGPNNSYYLCVAAGFWVCDKNALPKKAFDIFTDENHPKTMDTPRDVAFPMEHGMYLMRWTDKDGKSWQEHTLDANYARLVRFVNKANPTRTTFGPGCSYFSISRLGCSWQNIPLALEEDIQNCMTIRQPTCVALGVDDTYVVIYNDGIIRSELQGKYARAEMTIRTSASIGGLAYIALSPFHAEHFYAVYSKGGWKSYLPKSWTECVSAVSKGIQPITQKASSSSSAPSAPVVHKKTTWKEGLAIGFKVVKVATDIATPVVSA